jgi:hypothetical protein
MKMEDIMTLIEKIRSDIGGDKPEEEIFQSLLFGRDAERDEKVAELLVTLPHVKAGRLLLRMLEASQDKGVRKSIKRSLYRLKSKGISVEEVSSERKGSVLHPLETEPRKGFGGGFDYLGRRFLLLVFPHFGREWTVTHGVISDTEGLVDFSAEEMTRKGLRGFIEEIQEKTPFGFVEMEPSYVAFLFVQAYQLTLEKDRTPPQDYLRLRKEMEAAKKEYETPLIYLCLNRKEIETDDHLLREGGNLVKGDLFFSWKIEEDKIRSYADEVWEAEGSKILLHPSQKEARLQGIYQKALTELFSGERRALYQKRLEEMAYILFKLGKEKEARISLAVALDLKRPLNLFQPNPFLQQLVVKSIFALLADAYEKKAKEPSLIVKP